MISINHICSGGGHATLVVGDKSAAGLEFTDFTSMDQGECLRTYGAEIAWAKEEIVLAGCASWAEAQAEFGGEQ